MSSLQVYNDQNSNKGSIVINNSSPLKVNKDSHCISKSPSPSSSSSSASSLVNGASFMVPKAPPSQPLIIYTNSPKVIHTNPKDFMALVQKLTGPPRFEIDHVHGGGSKDGIVDRYIPHNKTPCVIEDNESTSVITDDNRCALYEGSNDFLAPLSPQIYSYSDSSLLMPNMRSSFSSPTFGSIDEF